MLFKPVFKLAIHNFALHFCIPGIPFKRKKRESSKQRKLKVEDNRKRKGTYLKSVYIHTIQHTSPYLSKPANHPCFHHICTISCISFFSLNSLFEEHQLLPNISIDHHSFVRFASYWQIFRCNSIYWLSPTKFFKARIFEEAPIFLFTQKTIRRFDMLQVLPMK